MNRAPQIGDQFGPYRIDRVIGSGAMGMVFGATDERLDRQVALKVVLGSHAANPDFARRFTREAGVLAKLDSPHVISVYDHGERDGTLYIAGQYAAGGDLGQLLRTHGSLPTHTAVIINAQLADALHAAHEVGVIHRDVKPANVLLRDDRLDRPFAYLTDFGVALTDSSGMTTPGAVAGTWNYLAPERTRGTPGDARSDVYSVGCLLYECLTGQPPYQGSDVDVAMQHLQSPLPKLPGRDPASTELDRIIAKAMAKDPGDRYQDALSLRDDLRAVAGRLQPTQPGGTFVPGSGSGFTPIDATGGRPRRKRRGLVVGVAAATVLAIGAGVGAVVVLGGDDEPGGPGSGEPGDEAILGDIDGDGFGDLAVQSVDGLRVFSSTGTQLEAGPENDPLVEFPAIRGEFDEGEYSYLVLSGRGPTIRIQTVTDEGPGPNALIRTTKRDATESPNVVAADVDGDGLDDLVVLTRLGKTGTLEVSLNTGDGGFGAAEEWYQGELYRGGFAVADFDDDGLDELAYIHNGDVATDLPPGLITFDSTGDSFEVQATTTTSLSGYDEAAASDMDGDGALELVTVVSSDTRAEVWEWEDGRFRGPTTWVSSTDPAYSVDSAELTDLDGDGDADLVVLAQDQQPEVYIAEEGAYVPANAWSDPIGAVQVEYSLKSVGPTVFSAFLSSY